MHSLLVMKESRSGTGRTTWRGGLIHGVEGPNAVPWLDFFGWSHAMDFWCVSRMVKACLLALLLGTGACKQEVKDQLYFEDLKPPLGVGKVEVVSDVSLNQATGGQITVLTAVEPEVDKDELDRLLKSFYRQVEGRRGFLGGGKPQSIDLRFYASVEKAKAGGEDWLARVQAKAGDPEESYENRQKPPLLKWAMQALGKMQEFTGTLKPKVTADRESGTIEIEVPMIVMDGSGAYVETLTFEKFSTEFASYTITLFEKLTDLKKLTFKALHNDKVMATIWLTREQYNELDIKQVEEQLGAYQGSFYADLVAGNVKEKQVEQKVKKQRQKVYKETLGKLPAGQVTIDKALLK